MKRNEEVGIKLILTLIIGLLFMAPVNASSLSPQDAEEYIIYYDNYRQIDGKMVKTTTPITLTRDEAKEVLSELEEIKRKDFISISSYHGIAIFPQKKCKVRFSHIKVAPIRVDLIFYEKMSFFKTKVSTFTLGEEKSIYFLQLVGQKTTRPAHPESKSFSKER